MRDRKKRNIIIGSLCCLLVFMGIGYAILSQTLNISGIANMKGNWNVKITNMELVDETKTGRAEEISHSFTDTTATFEADLYMPGDSIEYEVTVTNGGNIDAVLKSITPTTTNKNVNIKFSHSTIDNTVLTAGKTITFTMKVEFLEDATTIPNIDSLKYSLELVYVQYNGGNYTPAVEATEESCFKVTPEGTLLSYDSSCGTNVVVPATVNGIAIKKIGAMAFTYYSLAFITGSSNSTVFTDQDSYNKYVQALINFGVSEEEIGTPYIMGTSEFDSLEKTTIRSRLSSAEKYKVYNDSGTLKLEQNSDDFNLYLVSTGDSVASDAYLVCDTIDTCNLLNEYYKSEDPAREVGVAEETYYQYVLMNSLASNETYVITDSDLDVPIYDIRLDGVLDDTVKLKSIDLSHAIYVDKLASYALMTENTLEYLKFPPNIDKITFGDQINTKKIVFPDNTKLKVIGCRAFANSKLTSIEIPASVVSIGYEAFRESELTNITFEKGSKLVAIYGNDVYGEGRSGAFSGTRIQSVKFPSSLKYMGSMTFHHCDSLTQITLTSPADIDGWTNGSTVNGITVTYER